MNIALILVACATVPSNLQAILDEHRVDQQIPGVSAVVTVGAETSFSSASGLADLETGRPMTPDTIAYAGSLSKVFTAIAALRLVDNGKLSLDDPVAGIAERSLSEDEPIRVSHLLTHASGLEREGDFGYWFSADFPHQTALTDYLRTTTLREPPGESFHYSNIGYATLGRVIEKASGSTYANALDKLVLTPLGLTNSGAPGPVAGMSAGYAPVGRVIPNETRPFAGLGRQVGERRIREYHAANAMTPAFGIYTSANDLSRLARFLLGYLDNDLMSASLREQMLSAQESGWGLGIKIDRVDGRPVARHSGWFAAHRSHLLLDLQSGTSVSILANSDSAAPNVIAEALLDAMLSEVTSGQ